MKGKGHLNKKIAEFGRAAVSRRYKFKDVLSTSVTGYTVEIDGETYPCKVFTKVHDEREGLMVTGRDHNEILRLNEMQHKGHRVMLLFVDAKLGICYGDFYDVLMMERTFCNVYFPIEAETHAGKIIYWSVDLMPTLFELTPQEKEDLAVLISDNRTPKDQIRLL